MAIVNKGNVSEGLLGCALIAKFAARNGNKIGRVGPGDVARVWEKLKSSRIRSGLKNYQEHVYDINQGARDNLRIIVRLGPRTAKDLFHPKTLQNMSAIINSACSYVNSKQVESQALDFFENLVDDNVDVEVDGISGSQETKADIIIRDNAITLARLSAKSGSHSQKIGQVGGDTFGTFVRLFHGGINGKTGVYQPGLGLPVNQKNVESNYERLWGTERTADSLKRATHYIYEYAARLVASANDAQFLTHLSRFLTFHSAKNDDGIRIVVLEQISAGRHKVLNPSLLNNAILHLKDVRAFYKQGEWPTVLIYSGQPTPSTQSNKNVLVAIRAVYDSKLNKLSNHVEKGPLFDTLIQEKED